MQGSMRWGYRTMRIVQINTVASGCTGRIAISIKHVLEEHGHTCLLAYGRGRTAEKNSYRISNAIDCCLHGVLTRIMDSTGLHSKFATKKFLRLLDEYRPDVVHIHNLHGYYINYQMLLSYLKEKKIKTYWTLHDCWPFTGHCPYYTFVGCEKWKTGCHHCQQKRHHPTSLLVDRSKKNYQDKKTAFLGADHITIITPSRWLKGQVEQSFLSSYSVVNIPNGIDLRSFHPTENRFRSRHRLQDKVVILGVANLWAKTKGMDYFLALHNTLPRESFQIVLVGLSAKQVKEIPSDIIGIKRTENVAELADIYSSADVFLNPTLEDNFPTTNIEALACGTPVITFNIGGSPETIDDSCGCVVEADIDKIAAACVQIGKKTDDVIRACVERARSFDERLCFGKYLALYESEQ